MVRHLVFEIWKPNSLLPTVLNTSWLKIYKIELQGAQSDLILQNLPVIKLGSVWNILYYKYSLRFERWTALSPWTDVYIEVVRISKLWSCDYALKPKWSCLTDEEFQNNFSCTFYSLKYRCCVRLKKPFQ